MADTVVFKDNSEKAKITFRQAVIKALYAIGVHGVRRTDDEIRDMHAIDTGRLWESIDYKVNEREHSVDIGTNVEYAIYVHEGTRRMAARPYLKNGILNYLSEYEEIAMDCMAEVFE